LSAGERARDAQTSSKLDVLGWRSIALGARAMSDSDGDNAAFRYITSGALTDRPR
jgi:hypothetical protein